jgi:hypothetical protein
MELLALAKAVPSFKFRIIQRLPFNLASVSVLSIFLPVCSIVKYTPFMAA